MKARLKKNWRTHYFIYDEIEVKNKVYYNCLSEDLMNALEKTGTFKYDFAYCNFTKDYKKFVRCALPFNGLILHLFILREAVYFLD